MREDPPNVMGRRAPRWARAALGHSGDSFSRPQPLSLPSLWLLTALPCIPSLGSICSPVPENQSMLFEPPNGGSKRDFLVTSENVIM